MYKMGKKEIVLDPNTAVYDVNQNTVYSVGHYKIKLFSSIEDSISERNCLRLSKIKTKRIILPQHPVYHDEEYCGCAYKRLDSDDWIDCFFGQGIYLRESIMLMKEEIIALSQMGIDLVDMPSFRSCGDFSKLLYYGTDNIKDSSLTPQVTIQKNLRLFHQYLSDLVYNGMSEFSIDPSIVVEYLNMSRPITTTLENVLNQEGFAGALIEEDIKKKLLK